MSTPEKPEAAARRWLAENRPDVKVGARGRLSPEAWDAYFDGNEQLYQDPIENIPLPPEDETAPLPPKQEKKKWGFFSKEDKPKTSGVPRKRMSTSLVIEQAWKGLGVLASQFSQTVIQDGQEYRVQPLLPVARTLELQAPVAGEIFDDMVKGTVADKLLQPLARISDKGEDVFALVAPPIIATAICTQPALYPVLRPVMASALKSWVVTAGPKLRKAQEREAKLVAEMGEDYGSSIEEMLDYIFGMSSEPAGV